MRLAIAIIALGIGVNMANAQSSLSDSFSPSR